MYIGLFINKAHAKDVFTSGLKFSSDRFLFYSLSKCFAKKQYVLQIIRAFFQ